MRARIPTNCIGERISIKIQQKDAGSYWIIDDIGLNIITMGRRLSKMINAISHHLSMRIQGSGIVSVESETIEEYLSTESGDILVTESGEGLLVIGRTTITGEGSRFGLSYIKFIGEAYEEQ